MRRAELGDLLPVAAVLARAFETNPFVRWILPDDAHYARVGADFFGLGVANELAHGEVYTTQGYRGGALWLPPGSPSPGLWQQMKMALHLYKAIGSRTLKAAVALGKFEEARPQSPHWYLTVLGTDPEAQGAGVGSALLQPILDRCDRDALPAYLESSNPNNVVYYRRFGFEVSGEIVYSGGGPTVPLMTREPRR